MRQITVSKHNHSGKLSLQNIDYYRRAMNRKQKSHLLLYMIISILSCGFFLSKEVSASDLIRISSSSIDKLNDDSKRENLLIKRTIKTIYQGPISFPNDPDENKKIKWVAKNHEIVVTRFALPDQVKRLKSYNSNILVLQYINSFLLFLFLLALDYFIMFYYIS